MVATMARMLRNSLQRTRSIVVGFARTISDLAILPIVPQMKPSHSNVPILRHLPVFLLLRHMTHKSIQQLIVFMDVQPFVSPVTPGRVLHNFYFQNFQF